MLIVLPDFTWGAFLFTTITCALGVLVLGIGMTGYAFTHMGVVSQVVLVFSSLLMISPSGPMTAVGAGMALPILAWNWRRSRRSVVPRLA